MPFRPSFLLPRFCSVFKQSAPFKSFGLLGGLLASGVVYAEVAAVPPAVQTIDTPPQVVFEVILAEIALKRDKPQVALAAYADLALKYNNPEIFRRTFEVAAMNRQPELMLEAARLWVEKEPNSTDALNVLASTQILMGQYADAQPVLLRYLSLLPADKRPQELLLLGQRFPAQADPQRARVLIDAVTVPYQSVPDAQLARAQAALRAGDDPAALEAVLKARRLKPDSEPGVLLNAQIIAKKSPGAALKILAEYLSDYPNAAAIRAVYAQQLLSADRLADAKVQLQTLVEQKEIAPEPLFAAAAISIQAQDPPLAIQALQRLLTMDSVDASLIEYNLGLAYESQAELAKSRGESQRIAAADSDAVLHYLKVLPGEYFVTARMRAANLMARDGDLKAARALLETTPARDASVRAELVVGEATLVRDSGDVAGAFKLVDAALKKDPSSILLRYERGMLAERSGKMAVFEQSMREVIKRDPKYAQAYNALGFTYADRNIHLKESRVLLEKALSLSPNDPFILDSMGWLYYREKNYNVALEFLNKAASLRLDPEIIEHQVVVLKAMGRDEEAARVWRVGLRQFPDNVQLRDKGKALGLDAAPAAAPSQSL
jgi:tetratricopeptide (TPR) repeat protein